MARQSPERRNADELDAETSDLDTLDEDAEVEADDAEGAEDVDDERDPATVALWAETRIDPIEVALPTGAAYTLRAYRPSSELAAADLGDEDEEADDPFARLASHPKRSDDDEDEELAVDDAVDDDADDREAEEQEESEEDDEEDADSREDVPVFLSHRGRVLLFRSTESLVAFVRSDAEHDLTQLDTWADMVDRIRSEDVVPAEEDTYELDLVVENLRGGHDAWDAELLIGAGEFARDLAYAMRSEAILAALSPGSPLDDLDEAFRASVSGGLSGFLAKRRLKKIGAQQATLGWRTIIGKISGLVVWRD